MATTYAWQAVAPKKTPTASTTAQPTNTVPDYFGRTPDATEYLRPVSLPKVPGADAAIYDSFSQAQNLAKNLWGDAANYRTAVAGSNPAVTDYANQEIADIGKLYDPNGYEALLAGIRARRKNAVSGMTNTMLQDLRRVLNLDAVGRGGVSGTGLGSYLTSRAASEVGRLRAAEEYDAAAQERADLAQLMAGRTASQGRRQALTDTLLQRLTAPGMVEASATTAAQQALNQALQEALMNSTYAYGLEAY